MKNAILVISGVLTFLFSLAQDNGMQNKPTGNTLQFGLKGGVNVAKMIQSGPEPYDHRVNFHLGGFAHIHLHPAFAIQPELVYSRQGAEYSAGINKYDYINIPVLFQYMRSGFRLQTGPQPAFLLSAKFENRSNGVETDQKNLLEKFDFSWTFGAGYLTSSGLGVDARFNLGLTNMTKTINNENKQRVWQFGVFYQFNQ